MCSIHVGLARGVEQEESSLNGFGHDQISIFSKYFVLLLH